MYTFSTRPMITSLSLHVVQYKQGSNPGGWAAKLLHQFLCLLLLVLTGSRQPLTLQVTADSF